MNLQVSFYHDNFYLPMPSKYSHSVVLANYSNRGIINFPNSQQSEAATPSQPSARADTPPTDTRNTEISLTSSKAQIATLALGRNALNSSQQLTSSPRSQVSLSNQGRHSRALHHDDTAIKARAKEDNDIKSNQTTPQRASKKDTPPSARLTSPYNPYGGRPEFIPPRESPEIGNERHKDQGATKPLKRAIAYAAQTVQPRPGPPSATGNRPPPVSVNRVPSKSTTDSRLETLLSIQQFLDSSPRIDKPTNLDNRQVRTPEPHRPVKPLTASPELSSTTVKPTSAGQKNRTSFIDSSDEDDHIDNTPGTSVRSAATAPVVSSNNDVPTEPNVKLSTGAPAVARKVRLDLTKSLPTTPERDGSVRETHIPTPSHSRAYHTDSGQASEDVDDPFWPLPLQKHSPLRRTRTKDKRRSLGLPYASLREIEDDQPDIYDRPATKSAESLPLEPAFGDSGEDDHDDDDEVDPMMKIHVHRRYYRAVDDDIPEDEARLRITIANSWTNRRAATRTPTPVPWQSPVRDTDEQQTAPSNKDESEKVLEPNILTDAQPRSSMKSVQPVQNFGVPSIIRSPMKSPRTRMPQYRHEGGTNLMARPPKLPGSRSLQRHKQARSQHPPLTRIAEAKPQDEAPSDSTGNLPTVETTDSGVFGAEVFMRLSSENDTGAESEVEMRVNDTEFDAARRPMQDNFLIDSSTVTGDQASATLESNRTPSKPVSHNSTNKSLGSPISIQSTRAKPARPRTSRKVSGGSDAKHEVDEDEDDDDEESSASPPPDISRYRRPKEDENDGLQSLIHALKAGPTINHAGGQAIAKTQLTGIDRFEEMLRRVDEEDRGKKQQRKNKMSGVLGRFLKR